MDRRAPAAVLLSLLAHALLPLGASLTEAPGAAAPSAPLARTAAPLLTGAAQAAARAARIQADREDLVVAARADIRAGRLELGRFLLRANRLDADLRGEPFDLPEVEARYAHRLRALREALETSELRDAVPAVLGDLRYHGRPGGLMADALLEGGGSCEQIAHLVAALAYDAGRKYEIVLRYYGGAMQDGASHLAPIAVRGTDEHDLMTGLPAVRRGARFAAEELVEAYARVAGLAPAQRAADAGFRGAQGRRDDVAAAAPARPAEDRATMVPGYPQNQDRYPGTLPLYAARAVHDPGGAGDAAAALAEADDHARDCAYLLRLAILSPPAIDVEIGAPGAPQAAVVAVEPHRSPRPQRLEREAALLRAAEDLAESAAADPADRLMGWACLAGLGDVAAIDFTLAGEPRLAALAEQKRRRGRVEGKNAILGIPWSSVEGARVRSRLSEEFAGRTWLLLALEGGDEVVLSLVRGRGTDDWGQISALAALAVAPATRARALALIERLSLAEQIDIMHEVFHAHDHMRPWASNFDLGDAPAGAAGASFRRIYRVFRGLAWRLWEGQRPAREILRALPQEARAAGLDAACEAALLEYAGRNLLGLHAQRTSGLAVVRALDEAAQRSGHPSLDPLRRRLRYIASQARLDATTLADAMRMK